MARLYLIMSYIVVLLHLQELLDAYRSLIAQKYLTEF